MKDVARFSTQIPFDTGDVKFVYDIPYELWCKPIG